MPPPEVLVKLLEQRTQIERARVFDASVCGGCKKSQTRSMVFRRRETNRNNQVHPQLGDDGGWSAESADMSVQIRFKSAGVLFSRLSPFSSIYIPSPSPFSHPMGLPTDYQLPLLLPLRSRSRSLPPPQRCRRRARDHRRDRQR